MFRDLKTSEPTVGGKKTFLASVKIDTSIDAPTVVYASFDSPLDLTWYPNGYNLDVSSEDTIKPVYSVEKSNNRLSIKVTNSEFNGKILDIRIDPK